MADIHLVDGEKGGVGKSLFARTLLHYWLTSDQKTKPVLFDTDSSHKDVESFYYNLVECGKAYFSDDDEKLVSADEIFQTALFGKPVLVNLGASVYTVVTDWIQNNGLVELGQMAGDKAAMKGSPIFEELGKKSKSSEPKGDNKDIKFERVRFFKWFVCNGQQDSIDPFLQSLDDFGTTIPHILVQNRYLYDEEQWQLLLEPYWSKLEDSGVGIIAIPKLLKIDLKAILDSGLPWEEAIKNTELPLMQRQRLYMFSNTAVSEIDSIWKELDTLGQKVPEVADAPAG